jgi:hypothetical protein
MTAVAHLPLAERSYSPETSLQFLAMRPGLVLVPYETQPATADTPSTYQRLLGLKAQLDDHGIACTMDMHRTQPGFERIPSEPREDGDDRPLVEDNEARYEEVKPARHFALFTLEGVGEPQQEVMQELVRPGGMLAGETITLAGETYAPGVFRPASAGRTAAAARPNLSPAQTPDPSELITLLTGFSHNLSGAQQAEWQQLRDGLEVLTAHLGYLRTTRYITINVNGAETQRTVNVTDIDAQRNAIKAQNARIREFLDRATSATAPRQGGVGRHLAGLLRSAAL